MSTSKNVETCTALSTDARRLRAITLRIVDIGSTTSSPRGGGAAAAPAWRRSAPARARRGGGRCGRGRAPRRGGRSRGGAAAAPPRCSSTSFLVTRPPRPLPAICVMSRPCSATMRATTGDMNERRSRLSPFASASGSRGARRRGADDRHRLEVRRVGRGGGATSGASAAQGRRRAPAPRPPGPRRQRAARRRGAARRAPPPPPVSITAMRVPTSTVSPSADEQLVHGARGGRRDLGVDLVGRDLDDRLVRLHGLADLLAPGDDRALGHADSHLRHDDIDERSGTHGFLPAISRRRACGRRRRRRRPGE